MVDQVCRQCDTGIDVELAPAQKGVTIATPTVPDARSSVGVDSPFVMVRKATRSPDVSRHPSGRSGGRWALSTLRDVIDDVTLMSWI